MAAAAGLSLSGCQTVGSGSTAGPSDSSPGFRAVLAADAPKAVAVGRAMLAAGGQAADVAAAMGLSVAAGLPAGQGGACVVHDGVDRVSLSLDFISGAPAPGRIAGGMRAIHARWGKSAWTAIAGAAGVDAHIGADSPAPRATPAIPGPPVGPAHPMFADIPGGQVASDILVGMEQQYFIVASPPDRTHLLADATYRAFAAVKTGLKDPPGTPPRGKALMQGHDHNKPTQGAAVNTPDALRPLGSSFLVIDRAGFAIACSLAPSGGVLGAAPAVLLDTSDQAMGAIAATGRAAAPAAAQTITALGLEDFPLDDAMERPRMTADAGAVELEPDAGDSAYALEDRGWRMTKRAELAHLVAAWKFEDGWQAMADPRGKGVAATLTTAMLGAASPATTTAPAVAPVKPAPVTTRPAEPAPIAKPVPPVAAQPAPPVRAAGVWSPTR